MVKCLNNRKISVNRYIGRTLVLLFENFVFVLRKLQQFRSVQQSFYD